MPFLRSATKCCRNCRRTKSDRRFNFQWHCLTMMPFFISEHNCLRCGCFSGRFLFHRNLQTFRLRWKPNSIWIFMRLEMFSAASAKNECFSQLSHKKQPTAEHCGLFLNFMGYLWMFFFIFQFHDLTENKKTFIVYRMMINNYRNKGQWSCLLQKYPL